MADVPEEKLADVVTEEASSEEMPEPTPDETEVEEPESEVQAEGDEAEGVDEVVKSERGQKRVQQLANRKNEAETKARELEGENQTLKEQLEGLNQPEAQSSPNRQELPPWMQQPDLPPLQGEVTQEQLDQHIAAKAQSIVELQLAQRDMVQSVRENYDKDIQDLEKSYPDAFTSNDPKLSAGMQKVFANYKKLLQTDPTARFKDFAEPYLEARSGGVEEGRSTASSKLAQQESESAIRPTSQGAKTVSSEDQLAQMLASGEITAEEAQEKYPNLLPSDY